MALQRNGRPARRHAHDRSARRACTTSNRHLPLTRQRQQRGRMRPCARLPLGAHAAAHRRPGRGAGRGPRRRGSPGRRPPRTRPPCARPARARRQGGRPPPRRSGCTPLSPGRPVRSRLQAPPTRLPRAPRGGVPPLPGHGAATPAAAAPAERALRGGPGQGGRWRSRVE